MLIIFGEGNAGVITDETMVSTRVVPTEKSLKIPSIAEINKNMLKITELISKYQELIAERAERPATEIPTRRSHKERPPKTRRINTKPLEAPVVCKSPEKTLRSQTTLANFTLPTSKNSSIKSKPSDPNLQKVNLLFEKLEKMVQTSVATKSNKDSTELYFNNTPEIEITRKMLYSKNIDQIRMLTIAYNSKLVTMHPNTFNDFQRLETLIINYNKIKKVEGYTFKGRYLPQLKKLDLGYNKISTIAKYAFYDLPELSKLYLNNNNLGLLQNNVFYMLQNLELLQISATPLYTIQPFTFSTLTNLRQLILHYNRLSFLQPETFSNLKKLKKLDLAGNLFSEIPRSFDQLSNLEILDLMDNQIQELPPGVFNGLVRLKELLLNQNQIEKVSVDLMEPYTSRVQRLDISYNQIRSLELKFLNKVLPNLEWIDLTENLFSCSELGELLPHFEAHGIEYVKGCDNHSEVYARCERNRNQVHGVYCRDTVDFR